MIFSATAEPAAAARLYHVDLGAKRDISRALEAPWDTWLERDKQYFTSLLTIDAVQEAGWKAVRIKRLRDVEWAARLHEPWPLGWLEQLPRYVLVAGA